MDTACKHPKVRVVAREEDVEYVECLDCGQVFDSNEFRDMEIEEEVLQDPDEDYLAILVRCRPFSQGMLPSRSCALRLTFQAP